jgi:hypothetical protein
MKEAVAQEIPSGVVDRRQLPISVVPPAPKPRQPTPFRDRDHWVKGVPTAAPVGRELEPEASVEMPVDAIFDLEEFFEAIVDEITDDAVQLRTTSSTGEEGIAWLDLERIPEGERKYVELGAPVRVSILMRRDGTNRREHHIRVLRPFQWRPQAAAPETGAYLLEQMKAVLG